jgi:hypothetical protein
VWIVVDENKGEIATETRVEAADAAVATKLVTDVKAWMAGFADKAPEQCRDIVKKRLDAVKIDQDGAVIIARSTVPKEDTASLMLCWMK